MVFWRRREGVDGCVKAPSFAYAACPPVNILQGSLRERLQAGHLTALSQIEDCQYRILTFYVLSYFYWIHICFGMTANWHQSLILKNETKINHDSVALSLPRFGYKYLLYLCRVLICSLVYLSTFSLIVSFTTLNWKLLWSLSYNTIIVQEIRITEGYLLVTP